MEFLRQHQLNIMLILIGICGILAFLVVVSKTLSPKRKNALLSLELSAMLLLTCDRFAYIFRGDMSSLGFWMVRICNFCVYLFSITVIHSFNSYLIDLFINEGKLTRIPVRLRICKIISVAAIVCLIISQFNNMYYYFDENNFYVRGRGFIFSYFFPTIMLGLEFSVIIQYYTNLRRILCLKPLYD